MSIRDSKEKWNTPMASADFSSDENEDLRDWFDMESANLDLADIWLDEIERSSTATEIRTHTAIEDDELIHDRTKNSNTRMASADFSSNENERCSTPLDLADFCLDENERYSAATEFHREHDVYLSYRADGNDFSQLLRKVLANRGIKLFIDNAFTMRDPIASRSQAIKDSKVAVVVFSQYYASFPWCLDELAKILDCRISRGIIVIPVFYSVDRLDVENQTGEIKAAFDEFEQCFDKDMVRRWKKALTEVSRASGWDSSVFRDEVTLIHKIVDDIQRKVVKFPFDMSGLVGIEWQVRKVESLLCLESNDDVRVLGIWGMAGIGKSTIASIVYHKIAHQYDCSCFLEDISNKHAKGVAIALENELLFQPLSGFNLDFESTKYGDSLLGSRLHHRKVLIVLDDVNNSDQLNILVKSSCWFGTGSTIIITTRDKRLLHMHGVDSIYEVPDLKHDQALRLFCWHAFKQDQPDRDYLEISNLFVSYAGGLPLALKVLGRSLYKRRIEEWENALQKPYTFHDINILSRLERSFDELEDNEKLIFLDIACFFNGMNKATVRNVLEVCGFFADISLQILVEKSLITISDNKLFMHNLLQKLGRYIVHRESVKPEFRSRLWDPCDICHLFEQNMETPNVEAISLDMSEVDVLHLKSTSFNGIRNLKLLKFYSTFSSRHASTVQIPEGIEFLSTQLRYFFWYAYPLKSLPLSFSPDYLVELHLPGSNIEELWVEKKNLTKLNLLDVKYSKLYKLPDLSRAQNLLSLHLQGCKDLVEVSSIQYLTKLDYLNMRGCTHVKNLPSMVELQRLRYLNLKNCSNLEILPHMPISLENLYLGGTAIEELPSSVGQLNRLVNLDLSNCTRLKILPSSIFTLKSLKSLNIIGCSDLLGFASRGLSSFGSSRFVPLPNEGLQLGYNDLRNRVCHQYLSKPLPLRFFPQYLIKLKLENSNVGELWKGQQDFVNLQLIELRRTKLTRLPDLSRAIKLNEMILQGCTNLKDVSSIESLANLKYLTLKGCKKLQSLPCMTGLESLETLTLSGCSGLVELPELSTSIESLSLIGLAVDELPASMGSLTNLVKLDLRNCKRLKRLPSSFRQLERLESINVSGCSILLLCVSEMGVALD